MSGVDQLMLIVAAFTVGLFVWLEIMRRQLRRMEAEEDAREIGDTQRHHPAE